MKRRVLFWGEDAPVAARLAAALASQLLPAGTFVGVLHDRERLCSPEVARLLAELGLPGEVARTAGNVWDETTDLLVTLGSGKVPSSAPGPVLHHWQTVRAPGEDATAVLDAARANRDLILLQLEALGRALAPEPAIGVIGGSGFYDLPGLTEVEEVEVQTPFGAPSGPLVVGRLGGKRVVFLARHARGHALLPSEVNARANIYALKRAGVTQVLSISAVGSLREAIAPGHLALPTQFIDRTLGRPGTFFGQGAVAHVSLADPTCNRLGPLVAEAARDSGATVHPQVTYVCIEGPQFSTRAESQLFRSWAADVVGMTNLPEVKLAREAELCYVALALPTDYDCWRAPSEEVRVTDVLGQLRSNVELARSVVGRAIERMTLSPDCACRRVLDSSLVTQLDELATPARLRLHAILSRRLGERALQADGMSVATFGAMRR